ncbi:hypothetical protein [Psychrobacter sp. K31L]|uniref:hypothetical protein n=1 Tax=Psychrobacter sp. K31L TaxID=2820758 RepID=UPI001B320C03|nr:hypothetical protein [Psychrobacter sp. K31L]MBP3946751.1 hypothetical protein [Psychrobacter sp. K31L]
MLVSFYTVLDFVCLAEPNQLRQKEIIEINKSKPFTHYQVCEFNRLRIRTESVINKHEYIKFVVSKQLNEFDWEENEMIMQAFDQGITASMEIRGKSVVIHYSDGFEIGFETVFMFLEKTGSDMGWHEHIGHLLNLKVMYIGQTEITDGTYLRFEGHEKINKVANDVISNRPEKEVIVKLMSFQSPSTRTIMLPEIDSNDSAIDLMPKGELSKNIPKDDWKTVIEGTLIKYFSPEFNVHYRDNFPSEKHTKYNYFYDNNIRSVCVELH